MSRITRAEALRRIVAMQKARPEPADIRSLLNKLHEELDYAIPIPDSHDPRPVEAMDDLAEAWHEVFCQLGQPGLLDVLTVEDVTDTHEGSALGWWEEIGHTIYSADDTAAHYEAARLRAQGWRYGADDPGSAQDARARKDTA